tara:strand:+ start:498 stop:776 length:279 start_codon:yes stop_codon:yes gene_type:complete
MPKKVKAEVDANPATLDAPKRGRGRPKKEALEKQPSEKVVPKTAAPKPAGKRGANAWTTHLNKTFAAGKKKNANYKYSQAMKDAKLTYKKPK